MQIGRYVFLLSGIRPKNRKLWSLLRMAFIRKLRKHLYFKLKELKDLDQNILPTKNDIAMKKYTMGEMEDKYFGKKGTPTRDEYEYELKMELLGKMVKTTRKERNLTQEQLGKLIGVNKSQISKIENNANSARIDTILKVFKALKAEINFNVQVDNRKLQIA